MARSSSDDIEAELRSWRGVAGLLAERSLADRQDEARRASLNIGLSPAASSHRHSRTWTVPAPDDLDVGSSFSIRHPASVDHSHSSSAFHLNSSPPVGTPRQSQSQFSESHRSQTTTPKSVPGTPLRWSHPSTPSTSDFDKGRLYGTHRSSILSIHSPTQGRRSSRQTASIGQGSSQLEDGRADGLPGKASGLEILIPQRSRGSTHDGGSAEFVADTVLSASPPPVAGPLDDGRVGLAFPPDRAEVQNGSRTSRTVTGREPSYDLHTAAESTDGAAASKSVKVGTAEKPDASFWQKLRLQSGGLSGESLSRLLRALRTPPLIPYTLIDRLQLTIPQKQILKCSIAYFIASLFTFVPFFANLLSTDSETDVHGRVRRKPAYSAHMVATVMCYVSRSELVRAITMQNDKL